MQLSEDDLTSDGLSRIVAAKRAVAFAFKGDRLHCREAWVACGFAVELTLKRRIMFQNRFNTWPSRASRPELHVHDLRKLMEAARIDFSSIPADMRPSVRLVLDWSRGHDYVAARMPRRVANDMYQAAFGQKGVVAWIENLPL